MLWAVGLDGSKVVHLGSWVGNGEYRVLCSRVTVQWRDGRLLTVDDWQGRGGGRPASLCGFQAVPEGKRVCLTCLCRYRSLDSQLWDWLVTTGQVT